jgi:uncharacterized protein
VQTDTAPDEPIDSDVALWPARPARHRTNDAETVAVIALTGAAVRCLIGKVWPTSAGSFPWVTLLINGVGCALIGVRHRAGLSRSNGGRSTYCRLGNRTRNPSIRQPEDAMRLTEPALRLTILVGESDQRHHKPLFTEIVHRAHNAGLAGATVLRGVEGFGGSNRIHTTRLLSLSEDLPVAVIIVDTHDRIHAFLPQLDELVTEGLVILDDCEVIRHAGRVPAAS